MLASLGLLGSTLVIAHEHSKTKTAYAHEAQQREAAEESFRQARQAVDGFTQLAEQELAGQPMLQPLRRKFLELTLEYYRNFIEQRGDDSDPTIRAELAATSQRVERIVDELSALQRFAPLMLLADARVQQDLGLSATAGDQIDTLLIGLAADSDPETGGSQPQTAEARQHQTAELLRSTEQEITRVLTSEQLQRLHQIAWQQRGPFAFLSSEIATALALSGDQREQIRRAIERDRPGPGDPHRPGPGGPDGPGGPGGPGHKPPGPPPDGFRHGLRSGDSPNASNDERKPAREFGRGPGGPPPNDHGPGGPPPDEDGPAPVAGRVRAVAPGVDMGLGEVRVEVLVRVMAPVGKGRPRDRGVASAGDRRKVRNPSKRVTAMPIWRAKTWNTWTTSVRGVATLRHPKSLPAADILVSGFPARAVRAVARTPDGRRGSTRSGKSCSSSLPSSGRSGTN